MWYFILYTILPIWVFVVAVAALVLGMFLKKSSVVEKGPTGPLAVNATG